MHYLEATLSYTTDYLIRLIKELTALPHETGWLEFKHNKADPQEVGQYLSALSNTAALNGKTKAYVVWGVDDDTHALLGTTFKPDRSKVGNQALENWLLQHLSPKINFAFYTFQVNGLDMVLLDIDAAFRHPVQFQNDAWVRVGSYTKRLREFAEVQRTLWRTLDKTPYEWQSAADTLNAQQVLALLDYPSYFARLKMPLPDGHHALLAALEADRLIERMDSGDWRMLNLGALLFAKRLTDFDALGRKAIRMVRYNGVNRLNAQAEPNLGLGYAAAFELAVDTLNQWLPGQETIGKALRETVRIYPTIALRELIANALIHQDLSISGTSPLIEVFDDRIEISNPGCPLVDAQRLLDTPPRSRNEAVAAMLRRMNICEERGTGIDKVVLHCELSRLPAPLFETVGEFTRVTLFAARPLTRMASEDRIRAVYWHACLRHVNNQQTNNASIRERFGISDANSSMASRLLKEAELAKVVKQHDSNAAPKLRRYVPFWA